MSHNQRRQYILSRLGLLHNGRLLYLSLGHNLLFSLLRNRCFNLVYNLLDWLLLHWSNHSLLGFLDLGYNFRLGLFGLRL